MKSRIGMICRRVLAALFILGFCATARAQFTDIVYDGFNYAAGTLNGQNGGTGWTGAWTNGYTAGASLQVSATGMSYPGLANGGGSIVWTAGGNGISEASRALPRQSSGVIYFQFLAQFGSGSGFGTPNIRLLNSGALTGGFGGNGGTYGNFMSILDNTLSPAADGSSSTTALLSSTNLVIARIDYQSNTTAMWVNPDLATFNYQTPATAPDATFPGLAPVFDSIDLVTRNPANLDEITLLAGSAATPPPVLSSPLSNSTNGGPGILISYLLPATPLAGTVLLNFTNNLQSLTLSLTNATNVSFVLSPRNPQASTNVISTSPISGTLPDGLYTVQLSYQDTNGDPAATVIVTNVLVDTVTQPPVLLAPVNSAVVSSAGLHLSYQLPEAPLSGSVRIIFANSNTNVSLLLDNNLTNDFTIPASFLMASPAVVSASASALPDGVYAAQLSYQDALGNPAASALATNLLVDTVTRPPVLLAPVNSAIINSTGLHIQYQLPETPGPGSVSLIFQNSSNTITLHLNNSQANDFNVSPSLLTGAAAVTAATSSALPDGRYAVVLAYQDALFNPAAAVQTTNVLVVLQPLYFNPTSSSYSNGTFQFNFTNSLPTGLGFTYNVISSSNVNTPLTNWVDLGPAVESPPGHFQFQDTRSNNPAEFYLLRLH
jgi:hypothetical protein